MKINKTVTSILLTGIIAISLSIQTFAAQENPVPEIKQDAISTTTQIIKISPDDREYMEESLIQKRASGNLKLGEKITSQKDQNGGYYTLEVTAQKNQSDTNQLKASSGWWTAYTGYTLYYTDRFQNRKPSFKVDLSCRYYKNGSYSFIDELYGTATSLNNGTRCYWNNSMYYRSNRYHSLCLDVWTDGYYNYFFFDAMIDMNYYIDFGWSVH